MKSFQWTRPRWIMADLAAEYRAKKEAELLQSEAALAEAKKKINVMKKDVDYEIVSVD